MKLITDAAGGILRDILTGRMPLILGQEFYATPALLDALVSILLGSFFRFTTITESMPYPLFSFYRHQPFTGTSTIRNGLFAAKKRLNHLQSKQPEQKVYANKRLSISLVLPYCSAQATCALPSIFSRYSNVSG